MGQMIPTVGRAKCREKNLSQCHLV